MGTFIHYIVYNEPNNSHPCASQKLSSFSHLTLLRILYTASSQFLHIN
uniref:Uncharacterized protein n=1 Tax=Rhizophora mucronata TaxID=61149 RepID=A0A2P2IN83_RHIMU